MRNLLGFLSRNSFFLFFLFLEGIAALLLFQNNRFQRSEFLNSSNAASGSFYQLVNNATMYFDLAEINEQLAAENADLRRQLTGSKIEIFGKNFIINDTVYQQAYNFTEATVINSTVSKANNYITLNKGSFAGVEAGMGVIGPQGIIGIVKTVSTRFSSVMTVLHTQSKVSAKLKDQRYLGSLVWDGKDYQYGQLIDIPKNANVMLGDTVISSGYSSIFPTGINLATVTSIEKPEGKNFYDITVKLINDFKKIEKVYVVKNVLREEQDKLEAEAQEGDNND
ncbi:rod shape-determining protein MreC [Vicingaceae bacterium]|nr:rod shape-determining protein MreC [Vicingaceae bacterium]